MGFRFENVLMLLTGLLSLVVMMSCTDVPEEDGTTEPQIKDSVEEGRRVLNSKEVDWSVHLDEEGTLKEEIILLVGGKEYVFSKGSAVQFYKEGNFKIGKLGEKVIVVIGDERYHFQVGSRLYFNREGKVIQGQLAEPHNEITKGEWVRFYNDYRMVIADSDSLEDRKWTGEQEIRLLWNTPMDTEILPASAIITNAFIEYSLLVIKQGTNEDITRYFDVAADGSITINADVSNFAAGGDVYDLTLRYDDLTASDDNNGDRSPLRDRRGISKNNALEEHP